MPKCLHGIDSFLACRAASDHDTASAFRDWRRFIHKIRKIVTLDFFLDCLKQDGFLCGGTPLQCAEEKGILSLSAAAMKATE